VGGAGGLFIYEQPTRVEETSDRGNGSVQIGGTQHDPTISKSNPISLAPTSFPREWTPHLADPDWHPAPNSTPS
jgi:hypothetical protein